MTRKIVKRSTFFGRVHSVQPLGSVGKADHETLGITLIGRQLQKTLLNRTQDWNKLKPEELDEMNTELANYNWEQDMEDMDANKAYDLIKDRLLQVQDRFVPTKLVKAKTRPDWLTPEVEKART